MRKDITEKKILAIIPARGGSKGIPHKNLRKIYNGIQLVVYTALQAKESRLVDRTVVSTDDEKIIRTCEHNNIETIQRPGSISTDTDSSESAVIHSLEILEKDGYIPDIVVFLQCTSPVRNADDITNAIKMLIDNGYDSVFSVGVNDRFIWKEKNGEIIPLIEEYYKDRPRRQDRVPEYFENGSIYVFRRKGFEKTHNRIFGKKGIYVMAKERSFEIDDFFDLWLCRMILKKREQDE
jgi:CMP-N,N'-diacetyllegionaminic acid synthase